MEHTALLDNTFDYDTLRRKDDLFDNGVATVFRIKDGKASLHAFLFRKEQFTPVEARTWLNTYGFVPLHFQEAAGGLAN